jgi:hypothetical protein
MEAATNASFFVWCYRLVLVRTPAVVGWVRPSGRRRMGNGFEAEARTNVLESALSSVRTTRDDEQKTQMCRQEAQTVMCDAAGAVWTADNTGALLRHIVCRWFFYITEAVVVWTLGLVSRAVTARAPALNARLWVCPFVRKLGAPGSSANRLCTTHTQTYMRQALDTIQNVVGNLVAGAQDQVAGCAALNCAGLVSARGPTRCRRTPRRNVAPWPCSSCLRVVLVCRVADNGGVEHPNELTLPGAGW